MLIAVFNPLVSGAFGRALLATQMDLSLVTVPWFMCLFVNTLRPEVTLRVWDMFLCEGSKVLFRISAALLKKNEEVLVAASTRDSTELFIEMKKIGRNELDADALIAMAYKSYVPPFMKQRSLFTTSRSTGNLANSGRRGAGEVDAPLRKYNEASTVPPVLIGLGVAHTGPVMPLSPATSPLHSSSPFLFPPSIMDPSLVHLNKENENTNQVDLENGMKHWNQAQDPHGKDLKLKTFKEMKSKSERSFRPKIATPEAYSMSLSLPLSCLPELHVQTSVEVEEMLKNPVTARENERFASRQEGMVEATHSITDCCFDRTVMMQLGMSAFRSIPHNVETKSEGITNHLPSEVTSLSTFSSSSSSSSTNHATSEIGTPLSVTNIRVTNGTPSSPPASKSASTPTPIPLGITNRTVSKKKSKNYRNASSLFNILLSSNLSSTSKNSTDEYRSFKRSDIDRLREAFRQILMSRFP